MSTVELFALILLFFIASTIGVVTGSNSLITVPAMFQFGIDPKTAVATNMFGLAFMNIGAVIPFMREGHIDYPRLMPLALITLIASALGAFLVGIMSSGAIPIIVSVSMIVIVVFTLFDRKRGPEKTIAFRGATGITIILTFLLGIYGGLYSGGYVTVLTAVLVAFSGMTFLEAVASTKFLNVFSSSVAAIVFAWQGLIDYKLGIILAVTMFTAAFIGAKFATKMPESLIKRIFLAAVFLLAIKTIFDITVY